MNAVRVVVCWMVLVGIIGATAIGGAAPVGTPDSSGVFQQQFDADSVLIGVDVAENGTAEWSVRYRIAITTENESAAFEALQEDIQANRSAFLDRFVTRMETTVAAASNATGRAMTANEFSIETSRQPVSQSGFVTYSFTWTGFAAVDGETIRVGDAISGLFLDDQTSLTITWPNAYDRDRVDPQPDDSGDSSVSWNGRMSFANDEPRLVITEPGGLLASWLPILVGGTVLILIGAVGLFWYRRRNDESPIPALGGGDVAGGTVSDGPTGDAGTDDTPEELLSNEERVLRLVADNGGRMKQQAVVTELDWTEAKTSQVISGMQDDGDIEVFRIGRENVLKLPENDDF